MYNNLAFRHVLATSNARIVDTAGDASSPVPYNVQLGASVSRLSFGLALTSLIFGLVTVVMTVAILCTRAKLMGRPSLRVPALTATLAIITHSCQLLMLCPDYMATLSATPVRALVWLSEFSYLSLALLIACATLHLQLSVMAGRVKLARQLAGYYYDLVCVGAALVATHAYMYAFEIEWDQRYQMVVITGRHLPVLLYAWLTCYAWIFVIWIYLALASLVIIWAVLFNHGWVNGRWRRLVDSPRDTTRTMSTCRLVSSRLSRLVAALLASTSMTAISGLIRRCSLSSLEPSCRVPHPRSNCSKNDDKNTGSVLLGKDNAGSSNADDIGDTDYSHLETVLTHPTSPSPLRVKENPVRTLKLLLLRAMLGPISAMLCIAPSLVIQITAATRYLRPLYSSSAVIGSIQGILCFVYFVFSLEMAIYLNWVLDRAAM